MPSQTFSRKGIHLLGPSFIMFPEKVQQNNFTTLLFFEGLNTLTLCSELFLVLPLTAIDALLGWL